MKHQIKFKIIGIFLFVLTFAGCSTEEFALEETTQEVTETQNKVWQTKNFIFPDRPWTDRQGKLINAHSGGILYHNGFYHWYGTHKIPGTSERTGSTDGGIHCYRSRDLVNWNDFGIVLKTRPKDSGHDLAHGARIQRAKVVYNERTKKFVAFFKLYPRGTKYQYTYLGVATADSPTGPFTYRHKFYPASPTYGGGDFAMYKAPNGDLYHFTVRKGPGDRNVVKAKMRWDYLRPATKYELCRGVQRSTEGLAVFYKSGTYHLFGSGSNGWDPTAPRYYTSRNINGPWVKQSNPLRGYNKFSKAGPSLSFYGQSSFINTIHGKENQYILMMDVHENLNPHTSRYIWLPFKVKDRKMVVNWQDRWNMGWFDRN